ncbi:hypothetical protein DQG13_27805 [Paenibacillus sp. YN15]|nr:hypothetical protein DQG13_27805 [Paenibacillus sp. YN15]
MKPPPAPGYLALHQSPLPRRDLTLQQLPLPAEECKRPKMYAIRPKQPFIRQLAYMKCMLSAEKARKRGLI